MIRTMNNLRFFPMVLLTALFLAGGCATKPKLSESADSALAATEEAQNSGLDFELNGDSDSNKAGGLKTVYFDFNSSELTSASSQTLGDNAAFLKNNAAVKVQVEGHCDERGGVQYNLALGEKRAKTTRDYLVGQGVEASRISTISYGKERPVAFGHDEEAWSQNRRANFIITAK